MLKTKRSVFISRTLEDQSPFYQRLSSDQYQIHDQSLINFSPLDIKKIPSTDILFFYSKKGIEFALKNEKLCELMHQKELAAMGTGTEAVLIKNGFKVAFIGTGKPEETAALLDRFLGKQSILFLRAEHSKQSVQQLLSNPKRIFDLAIYSNKIKEKINIPSSDMLVFTSPMNAKAFFQHYDLQDHQKVIAIGNTTAQALRDLEIHQVNIAKRPSENALVDAVINLSK